MNGGAPGPEGSGVASRLVRAGLALTSSPRVRRFLVVLAGSVVVLKLRGWLSSRPWVLFTAALFIMEIAFLLYDATDLHVDGDINRRVQQYIEKRLEDPLQDVKPASAVEVVDEYVKRGEPPPKPKSVLDGYIYPKCPKSYAASRTGECIADHIPDCPPGTPIIGNLGKCEHPDSKIFVLSRLPFCDQAPEDTPCKRLDDSPDLSEYWEQIKHWPRRISRLPGGIVEAVDHVASQGFKGWLVLGTPVFLFGFMAYKGKLEAGYLVNPYAYGYFLATIVAIGFAVQWGVIGLLLLVRYTLASLGAIKMLEMAAGAPVKAAEFVHRYYGTEDDAPSLPLSGQTELPVVSAQEARTK